MMRKHIKKHRPEPTNDHALYIIFEARARNDSPRTHADPATTARAMEITVIMPDLKAPLLLVSISLELETEEIEAPPTLATISFDFNAVSSSLLDFVDVTVVLSFIFVTGGEPTVTAAPRLVVSASVVAVDDDLSLYSLAVAASFVEMLTCLSAVNLRIVVNRRPPVKIVITSSAIPIAVAMAALKSVFVVAGGTAYVRMMFQASIVASGAVAPVWDATSAKYCVKSNLVGSKLLANSITVSMKCWTGTGGGGDAGAADPPPEHEGAEQLDTSPIPGIPPIIFRVESS